MKNPHTPQCLEVRFSALGEPTRFQIIEKLLERGETSAGDLGDYFDISAPAISRHLKVLTNAGLVHRRVDKQRRLYSADIEALVHIHEWTKRYTNHWTNPVQRSA